jgi:hypothetical protein
VTRTSLLKQTHVLARTKYLIGFFRTYIAILSQTFVVIHITLLVSVPISKNPTNED